MRIGRGAARLTRDPERRGFTKVGSGCTSAPISCGCTATAARTAGNTAGLPRRQRYTTSSTPTSTPIWRLPMTTLWRCATSATTSGTRRRQKRCETGADSTAKTIDPPLFIGTRPPLVLWRGYPFPTLKKILGVGVAARTYIMARARDFLKIETKNKQNAPFFATAPERWRR